MSSKRSAVTRPEQSAGAKSRNAYRRAVVTFLDILGFRELVHSASAAEVSRRLDGLEQFAVHEPSFEGTDPFQRTTIQFSDSVIRVRPVDLGSDSECGVLFFELLDLAQAQAALVQEGVLVRGGVAFGDVCVEGTSVFGPAVIEAYEMESRFAVHPRIVISPDLMRRAQIDKSLKLNSHDFAESWEHLSGIATRGEDGLWFVDYLRAAETEFDAPEDYIALLRAHRELIVDAGKRAKRFDTIAAKYVWLASYHNRWIRSCNKQSLRQLGTTRRELLVRQNVVPGFVVRGPRSSSDTTSGTSESHAPHQWP